MERKMAELDHVLCHVTRASAGKITNEEGKVIESFEDPEDPANWKIRRQVLEPDYVEDGVEYIRISRMSGKLGKSTEAVKSTISRLKLKRKVVKFGEKKIAVLPPETVEALKKYYQELAAKRPKKVNYPKDMRYEECVSDCIGCSRHLVTTNKCKVSINPSYQWRNGECWIRKAWEGR